jgi:hypothetical protein
MAGLVWITQGGGGDHLSRQRLIANCTAATTPRRDVVTRMHRFLSDLDEQMASRFEALMTNERAEFFLMDRTMGDVTLIKKDNLEEIYRDVERIAAERVTREKDLEIARLEAAHTEEVERLAGEKTTEALRAAAAKQEAEQLGQRVGDLQRATEDKERTLMEACRQEGVRAAHKTRTVIAFVMLGIAVFLGLGTYFIPEATREYGAKLPVFVGVAFIVLGAGFSVLNYFAFPGRAIEGLISRRRDEAVLQHAKNLSIEEMLDRYEINWKTNEVVAKALANIGS